MSPPFSSTASAVARRVAPLIAGVVVFSFCAALGGCNGEQPPADDADFATNQRVRTNREEPAGQEDAEAEIRKKGADDRFQLYLRPVTRIPTAGYECAFAVSLQNRSNKVVEMPEGSLVVFSFVRSDQPDAKPVTRTVSLEQSYRVPPDSITDLKELWVTIPEAGHVKVHCELHHPVTIASNTIGLEVERHLLHDGQGPVEPPVIESPGDSRRSLPVAPKD